ncbi:MAG: glucosaminidase domain-containing protein [Bacteroidales bacterium]|nr:glucosaminidase domain-containing protein [Bacteroidales bacterium]
MKVYKVRICSVFVFTFLGSGVLSGQKMTREMYIEKYKDIAIVEMKRSGIPASITLAQGILESNCGNSSLAVDGNNHFGIKCHNDWKGKRMYHDDDEKGECFRKYKSADESYKDHTDFLVNTSRYDFLFELDPTDYKGWAKGLKKAGYATSSKYADALITIIEDEQLYVFDTGNQRVKREKTHKSRNNVGSGDEFQFSMSGRQIYEENRAEYIITKEGDTFYKLAEEMQMMPWEFQKYNDLSKDAQLNEGQRLYIQPKRNKAAYGNDYHFVEEGETLYDISQQYAIKMSALRKKNHLKEGEEPTVGDKLYLRKKNKEKPVEVEEPQVEEEIIVNDSIDVNTSTDDDQVE